MAPFLQTGIFMKSLFSVCLILCLNAYAENATPTWGNTTAAPDFIPDTEFHPDPPSAQIGEARQIRQWEIYNAFHPQPQDNSVQLQMLQLAHDSDERRIRELEINSRMFAPQSILDFSCKVCNSLELPEQKSTVVYRQPVQVIVNPPAAQIIPPILLWQNGH